MNLIIDAGNQRIKLAIYQHKNIIAQTTIYAGASYPDEWHNYTLDAAITSNTGTNFVIANLPKVKTLQVSDKLSFPFTIAYNSPQTLGTDRLAAIMGALIQNATPNFLCIDLGTCITYDVLIDNQYLGGSISPGVNMRHKAMAHFTARLPEVPFNFQVPFIGIDTESCLQSGVYHGTLQELNGIIYDYKVLYPDIQVFMTGGDAPYFEKHLKHSIFAAPNLVLDGLNFILNYNLTTLKGIEQ
jgi:type III pantothenate kinase